VQCAPAASQLEEAVQSLNEVSGELPGFVSGNRE